MSSLTIFLTFIVFVSQELKVMAGIPRIVTIPLISYSYTGSGAAFNILYTNSSYIKLSTGFNSGAAQAASTGIMVLGSSISKTIANTTLKGPDHVSVIANSIMPVTTVVGAFGIKVNGGPIWNKATSLTYNGGWRQAIADPTATPSGTPLGGSGTALAIGNNVTNISMHMDQTYTGSSESMFEAGGMAGSWIGKEITVDGGTSTLGNEITFQSISDQDRSQTFNNLTPFTGLFLGHVEIGGGVSSLNAPIQIGNADGTTVTHMLEKNTTLEWTDNPVNLKFYRLDFIGAATTIIWGDPLTPAPVSISCAGTTNRWALNTATQEPAGFTVYGDNLKNGRAWTLGSNSIFDGGLWQDITDIAMNPLTQVLNKQVIACRFDYGLPPVVGKLTGSSFSSPIDYCMTVANQVATMTIDYSFTASARGAGKAINFTHTVGNILILAATGYYQPVLADVTVSGAGTVSFPAGNPAAINVTIKDEITNLAIEGAAVTIKAAAGGPFKFKAGVTISRVGSLATVSHIAGSHGLSTGQKVAIDGAIENEYNRIKTVTVINSGSYTFPVVGTPASPATGQITSTAVLIDGLTDINGQISDSRIYVTNQPFTSIYQKGRGNPIYKARPGSGTVDNANGAILNVLLTRD